MALAALKELAMDSVQEGVTIADFSLPDQPLIYANHGFELITGYSIEETVGHNCRFLQGPDTEPEKLAHIRRCINAGERCTVQLKNYRKNGEEFINYLSPRSAPPKARSRTTSGFSQTLVSSSTQGRLSWRL